MATTWLALLLAALVASGCDDSEGTPDSGSPDGDADADDADGDTGDADVDGGDADEPVVPEMIGWHEPEEGAVAPRNRPVSVGFVNEVDPETLTVEINGEVVRLYTTDDVEYRFVPLPLFQPDLELSVSVIAGVTDVLSNVLAEDFTWTFRSEAVQVERTGDPELTAEEVAHITAGGAEEPMDVVTDWENDDSTLYDISLPVDPASPDVQHLVERMLVSVDYHGGIGLAAPQVGVNRRLFVADVGDGFVAILNPVILAYSDETGDAVEGCLSIPGERFAVFRPRWVEFEHDEVDGTHVDLTRLEDPESNPFFYPARVWLHEFDHLNGILISDRATIR